MNGNFTARGLLLAFISRGAFPEGEANRYSCVCADLADTVFQIALIRLRQQAPFIAEKDELSGRYGLLASGILCHGGVK